LAYEYLIAYSYYLSFHWNANILRAKQLQRKEQRKLLPWVTLHIWTEPLSLLTLVILDKYAMILDSSFKIPGTNRTIGIGPILGLTPVAGPLIGYVYSAMLIFKLVQLGASKRLVLEMLGNITLDATVGTIPLLGTIFDFVFKANNRNVRLLLEYHDEGKHTESSVTIFLTLALLIFAFVGALGYAT
jgi:hypothetical protein